MKFRSFLSLVIVATMATFAIAQPVGPRNACYAELTFAQDCMLSNFLSCAANCQGSDLENNPCENVDELCQALHCCPECVDAERAALTCVLEVSGCTRNCNDDTPVAPSPANPLTSAPVMATTGLTTESAVSTTTTAPVGPTTAPVSLKTAPVGPTTAPVSLTAYVGSTAAPVSSAPVSMENEGKKSSKSDKSSKRDKSRKSEKSSKGKVSKKEKKSKKKKNSSEGGSKGKKNKLRRSMQV